MSIFGSVIKIVGDVVKALGPILPALLGLIKTQTDAGDREGLLKTFGILKAVGAKLIRLAEIGENSIDEVSEGGTAITGNEYKAFAEEAYEIKREIEALKL